MFFDLVLGVSYATKFAEAEHLAVVQTLDEADLPRK